MKKIVGIIAALALAGSVFARPDITPTITEFGGNAKLEWIANLDPDPMTMGFQNAVETRWVIQFCPDDYAGESSSGDGLWGEINLQTKGGKKMMGPAYDGTTYENNAWTIQKLEVATAKLHFIDGDTYLHMDILKPDFEVGKIEGTIAIDRDGADYNGTIFDGVKPISDYNGFTINFGVPIVDLSFAFGDNGVVATDAKEFAFKLNAVLKPVDGLKLSAGFAYATANKDNFALGATAAYKYALDDKMYIQPYMNFTMLGKKMDMAAAVLFGWGAGPANYNHPFLEFKNANISPCNNGWKATDGISVTFKKGLKTATGDTSDVTSLWIDFYDSSLLAGVVPGLKLAARYAADTKELGKGAASFGVIYNNTFDIVYVDAKLSFGVDLLPTEKNTAVKYELQVGTKEVISNTDLYLNYAASISEYVNGTTAEENNKKGTVKLGCKITF